uniref:Uncharacterized protein n=1 Tax=Vespula pensylvanica TaxID=30213 RepID=A0A834U8V6_VESPE|nr:hypothetical protein H0235_008425 [Vespula pensylvanica]
MDFPSPLYRVRTADLENDTVMARGKKDFLMDLAKNTFPKVRSVIQDATTTSMTTTTMTTTTTTTTITTLLGYYDYDDDDDDDKNDYNDDRKDRKRANINERAATVTATTTTTATLAAQRQQQFQRKLKFREQSRFLMGAIVTRGTGTQMNTNRNSKDKCLILSTLITEKLGNFAEGSL